MRIGKALKSGARKLCRDEVVRDCAGILDTEYILATKRECIVHIPAKHPMQGP